ncbi:MAG TPA: hypothetical protein VKR26_01765, partial [Terriglobales bacterium]|nr:hypothetical protein [Terriglobales bacterium]
SYSFSPTRKLERLPKLFADMSAPLLGVQTISVKPSAEYVVVRRIAGVANQQRHAWFSGLLRLGRNVTCAMPAEGHGGEASFARLHRQVSPV